MEHYHTERNHQGLDSHIIHADDNVGRSNGAVNTRSRLGGFLNYYYREAAWERDREYKLQSTDRWCPASDLILNAIRTGYLAQTRSPQRGGTRIPAENSLPTLPPAGLKVPSVSLSPSRLSFGTGRVAFELTEARDDILTLVNNAWTASGSPSENLPLLFYSIPLRMWPSLASRS